MGVSWRLLTTALIVAFGSSFQSGYYVSLYNVPQDIIEQYINESIQYSWNRTVSEFEVSTIWAAIASSNQAGKVIAVFLAPIAADRIGRKWTFIFSNILSVSGIVMQYLAQPTGLFLLLAIGRFINGFYTGIVGVLVPLFLIEIAVIPAWRGSVTRIHNVVTILGNMLAFVFGIPEILGTASTWGYLSLIALPMVLIETFWLMAVPDSPLYLLQSGRDEEEVEHSLRYYLGDSAKEFESSLREAVKRKQSRVAESKRDIHGWWDSAKEIRRNAAVRKVFILWIMLALSSSFSGGNVTTNFLTAMIADTESHFTNFDRYASVVVNGAKIIFVLLALYVIDKLGRKPLLLSTTWSVMFCYVVLALIAFLKQFLKAAINSVSVHWADIAFLFLWTAIQYVVNSTAALIVSETAMQKSRALSLSIFKLTYHLSGVALTFAWPPIARWSEGAAYTVMAIPYLVTCVYLTIKCPETKSIDLIGQEVKNKKAKYNTDKRNNNMSMMSLSSVDAKIVRLESVSG